MHVVWLNKTWRWKDGDNTAQKMEFALKIFLKLNFLHLLQKFFTDIFTSVSQTTTRFFYKQRQTEIGKKSSKY